jgi:membrane peptidoglycan carboxypeptidase
MKIFRAVSALSRLFGTERFRLSIDNWPQAEAPAGPPLRIYARRFARRGSRSLLGRLIWISVALATFCALLYELRTSSLQSRILHFFAGRMSYRVQAGPSPRIVFPEIGPFDARRGYTRIPEFRSRLEQRNFRIAEQARFSPALERIARWGIGPPYRSSAAANLVIHGQGTVPIFTNPSRGGLFESSEEVPPLLVQTLLLMENRELGDSSSSYGNPVIEWDRLARAGLLYAGRRLGFALSREGGSTLATQIEKFKHSAQGRTGSVSDKLIQMTTASLKVYRGGLDTRSARREIMLDYLNSIPLAAVPGRGEVHGIGDGLLAWFGLELREVSRALLETEPTIAKAVAFKHVLALLAAVRAPTHYLVRNRRALEDRISFYVDRLLEAGIIDRPLAASLHAVSLNFADGPQGSPRPSFVGLKPSTALRKELLGLLGVPSFYDLERLHREARSTIDVDLQKQAADLFQKLQNLESVDSHAIREDRMLASGDPSKVIYGLVLYERTAAGNALRVQTDTLDTPFDVNTGPKMELGSTAKLRTLAHYLELVALLHGEFASEPQAAIAKAARAARDPLTRWVAETMANPPLQELGAAFGPPSLEDLIDLALARQYSANPGEVFFTGGGKHTFGNFDPMDNGRLMSIREATRRSVNLVFVRLMRDLVRFHQARLPYDVDEVLLNRHHPMRMRILADAAEAEAKQIVLRSYREYRSATPDQILLRLLGPRHRSLRALSIVFFAWKPYPDWEADREAALSRWLAGRLGTVSLDDVRAMIRAYGNPNLHLLDYGYLLRRYPLELFCAGALAGNPGLTWQELWQLSGDARERASDWLLATKHKKVQDLRLRIRFEQDAFARMTPYWRRLGFPFDRLTPSYATAIGSSGDRPAALAELMGIIVNDGRRMPEVRLEELLFARGTPYQTAFTHTPPAGEQALPPEVARALRGVLAEVVEGGTARRIRRAFATPEGNAVTVGGKTGSGDNRFQSFNRQGHSAGSRVASRTAVFVFYVGDRFFGVLLAYVPGKDAAGYRFTSALPVSIMRILAPAINERLGSAAPAAAAGRFGGL